MRRPIRDLPQLGAVLVFVIAVALPAAAAPAQSGRGAGLALLHVDADRRPDGILVSVVAGDGTVSLVLGSNLGTQGFESSTPLGNLELAEGVRGIGASAAPLVAGAPPALLVAWMDASGIAYRLGHDVSNDGIGRWSEPAVRLPYGAGGQGLGAALYDIDLDGAVELVLGWVDGSGTGRYVVGSDLDEDGHAASWGPERTIGAPGEVIGPVTGLSLACTGLDGSGAELTVAWTTDDDTPTFAYRTGLGLSPQGVSTWTGITRSEGNAATTGLGLAVANVDEIPLPDLVIHAAPVEGVFALLNPPLLPPYEPTEAELTTIGEPTNGLSVAAVRAQLRAGLYSSWDLVQHVERFVPATARTPRQYFDAITEGLAVIRPELPEAVHNELMLFLLTRYGIDPSTIF